MLLCNLAVLLAERNLKITQVAKDTGISRTTITSLTTNAAQGIQFETLNMLCTYLKVNPENFFTFLPFSFKVEVYPDIKDEEIYTKYEQIGVSFDFTERTRKISATMLGYIEVKTNYNHYGITSEIDSDDKFEHLTINLSLLNSEAQQYLDVRKSVEQENQILEKYFSQMPIIVRQELEKRIIEKFFESIPNKKAKGFQYEIFWPECLKFK